MIDITIHDSEQQSASDYLNNWKNYLNSGKQQIKSGKYPDSCNYLLVVRDFIPRKPNVKRGIAPFGVSKRRFRRNKNIMYERYYASFIPYSTDNKLTTAYLDFQGLDVTFRYNPSNKNPIDI